MKQILLLSVLALIGCADKEPEPQYETLVKVHAVGCDADHTTFLSANDRHLRIVTWSTAYFHPQCSAWNYAVYWDVTIQVSSEIAIFRQAQISK